MRNGRSRSYRCDSTGRPCGYAREPLLEVPDQIANRLGSDRQTDRPRSDTGSSQLVVVELPMRRAGRVNDQALRVADVRQVRPQSDAADEVLAGGASSAAI